MLVAIIKWLQQKGTMCIKKNSWHCLLSAKMQGIGENKQKIDIESAATRRILDSPLIFISIQIISVYIV